MENYWEEGLDLDDSDLYTNNSLPSLLSNPPLKPCSNSHSRTQTLTFPQNPSSFEKNPSSDSPRVVPGPAGAIQLAMNRIKKRDLEQLGSEEELIESGFGDFDGDFLLDSWIYAVRFVGKEMESITNIASIATRAIKRIPLVVGLVKSCTPNGLGDLFLTLKDQSGTIGASIHRKNLLEKNLASDITIGSVLILKQVVVFSPTRSVQYLNITHNNLVKIIGKNCGPPQKDSLESFTEKIHSSGNQMGINKDLLPQMENITNMRSQNSMREFTSSTLDFSKILSNVNPNKNTTSTNPTINLPKCHQTSTSNSTGGSSEILNTISGDLLASQVSKDDNNLKENLKPTQENNIDKEKVVSKVSVPEWTDDQLSELFADY